ncbi:MAG: hypothetical protein D6744_14930 [Planctomycetota bacterium]|nr:MAG: hypothetical protein D6744_14930 [Planctomycetota bacterium]
MILAQFQLFEVMRDTLNRGPDETELRLVAAGGLFLILLLLTVARWRSDRRRGAPPPVDHLTTVVDVLELSEQDRRDLRDVVSRAALAQPVAMLVTPRNFAQAVRAADVEKDAEMRTRLDDLAQRMFGAPLERLDV